MNHNLKMTQILDVPNQYCHSRTFDKRGAKLKNKLGMLDSKSMSRTYRTISTNYDKADIFKIRLNYYNK